MSRLDRYVFRELLGPTLLGLLIYGVVLLMNLLLQAAELFIRRDLPLQLVGQYIALSLPRILVLIIPMAVLLGVLVGIGRLAADSEITALRACGISDRRLLVPVAALGLAASGASWGLFNLAVPAANYAQHQLNARIFLSGDINREIQPRVFYENLPNMLIYADAASPSEGTLQRVLLYQKSPTGHEELSIARTLSMKQEGITGTIEFHLDDVVSHAWQTGDPSLYQISHADTQVLDRPPDLLMQEMVRSLTAPPPRNLREQTVAELRQTLVQLRGAPLGRGIRRMINETLVELHKKYSLPATSLVFSILALPLALGRRRNSGRTRGFVISLLVIILSYAMLTAGEQLADRGALPPWLAMWAGNGIFLVIAVLLLVSGLRVDFPRRRRRRRRAAATAKSAAEGTLAGARAEQASADAASQAPAPPEIGAPRRFLYTIDRYLLRHLMAMTLVVALSLLVLFTLFYAINLIEDITQRERPFSLLLRYLLFLQPQALFTYVAPISLCIGTLVTFALLARTHQLVALRAGGIGLFRVAAPFVLASTALGVLSFFAHDILLPVSNQKANQVLDQIHRRSPRSYKQPERRWVFGSQGLLFNFSDFNPRSQEFQDLSVFRFHPGTFDIAERTFAQHAAWKDGAWRLQNGWVRRFEGGTERYAAFSDEELPGMDPPTYFTQDWKAPDQMDYAELRRYVKDLERRGYDTRELRVGLYRKVSIPAVCIVMVLMSLPFALRVERKGPVFAIGISILLVFVYYMVLQLFGKMGEIALLPPLLAAWAPNLLFGGLGLYATAAARW
jgi:LPS export ABC transporter permease LptG/LPS export ABC transporter permease LptF